jgi:hypothetical protein
MRSRFTLGFTSSVAQASALGCAGAKVGILPARICGGLRGVVVCGGGGCLTGSLAGSRAGASCGRGVAAAAWAVAARARARLDQGQMRRARLRARQPRGAPRGAHEIVSPPLHPCACLHCSRTTGAAKRACACGWLRPPRFSTSGTLPWVCNACWETCALGQRRSRAP